MFNFAYFLDVAFLDVDEDFCYIVHFDTCGHAAFEIDTSEHLPQNNDGIYRLDQLLQQESSTITICPTGHESFHLLFNETVQPLINKQLVNRETWHGKGKRKMMKGKTDGIL